jgi:hypothetical protein
VVKFLKHGVKFGSRHECYQELGAEIFLQWIFRSFSIGERQRTKGEDIVADFRVVNAVFIRLKVVLRDEDNIFMGVLPRLFSIPVKRFLSLSGTPGTCSFIRLYNASRGIVAVI